LTESGFASFFQEQFGRMVVLLYAMGASRADAEDATQEAMFSAWRQWDSIHQPVAWVRTVAVRTYWRQVRSRQQTVPLDEPDCQAVGDSDLRIFSEEQQQVLRMLRALPPEQRTVVALRYDEATCEEIAALTGKPPATVRSHLRHARKTLKELMSSGGT
jgi:RNA polymerase sigma factor (sigma-70 family)